MNLQRIRVPLGFLYGAAYLYWASPRQWYLLTGVLVAVAGLALRIWASGHLQKGRVLATRGPYMRTRNPLYLGSFLMGLGLTAAGSNPWLLGAFPVLFLLIYIPVMRREESELERAFGHQFRAYRGAVPLFVPSPAGFPSRPGTQVGGNFQWRRVISNREYRAVIGFVIIIVLIVSKMLWA